MKRLKLGIVVCVALMMFGGCVPIEQQINTLTNDVDKLMVKVDNYQEKYAEEVDRVQEHIVVINEAVKEKANQSFVEQVEAGIAASKPFNPYADEMTAILGLVTVIGGLWAKGKLNEKKKVEAKYQAHKTGTEVVKLAHPEIAAEIYEKIGEARAKIGV